MPRSATRALTASCVVPRSWVVHDAVSAGYQVRAVVRDKSRPDKVDHILAINDLGFAGSVELFEADLGDVGSYDAAFAGCAGICHCGAVMGRPGANKETPQEVFDGSFTEVRHVWDSAVKAGTVKRFVQTSSMAAVAHGPPDDYVGDPRTYMQDHVFTEGDWTTQGDANPEMIPLDRNVAYAAAKKAAELALYDLADQPGTSFDACAIHPTHVLGPLKAVNNDDYLR
jgi:nucleoside-diphosphate-sugar epimerase